MDKKKRHIIKGGTAAIITTLPARAVWANGGTLSQVSGNLSGNLSFPTQQAFSERSGKSPTFWRDHYVGCADEHFEYDKRHNRKLKKKLKKHENKFYIKGSWKDSYSKLSINDHIGNYTYYDALYSSDPFIVQIATAKINISFPELKYPYDEETIDNIYVMAMNGEIKIDDITKILEEIHREY